MIAKLIRLANRLVGSSHKACYEFAKAIYWRLPKTFRLHLMTVRIRMVSQRLTAGISDSISSGGESSLSRLASPWLARANNSEKIAVVSCGFEFDELVNQRPINAAKYFADQGYFVIFVAWQWSPREKLIKGCAEVQSAIFQVPLYDFLDATQVLHTREDDRSLFLVTFPAIPLVDLVRPLRSKGLSIIYDIMDEWECFFKVGQATWYDMQLERSLVLESDHVMAVSPSLVDKFSSLRNDINLIGNGYSAATIGPEHKFVAKRKNVSEHIVGYFGHLTDSWFNWDFLFSAVSKLPDVKFEIIGYGAPDWVFSKAVEFPNLSLVGKILPRDLHTLARHWSAALIPFKESPLAEAVDPIKIYEYLYFALPVVSTGIKHIQHYPYTSFATTDHEFIFSIKQAISCEMDLQSLDDFLQQTTWSKRFSNIENLLNSNTLARLYAV